MTDDAGENDLHTGKQSAWQEAGTKNHVIREKTEKFLL